MIAPKGHTWSVRHGHCTGMISPTYNSWRGMLQRCRTTPWRDWHLYAGRGITVCDRWRVFDNFLLDMGIRPEGKSIDRLNNDLGYYPGNCAWRSTPEQGKNRRTSIPDELREIVLKSELSDREVARLLGISQRSVGRIRHGKR